jgi:hypothetical protein
MQNDRFDKEETERQFCEVLALIANLRPDPNALLVSRAKVRLMAAVSGDADLIRYATLADENTLFWELDGEFIEQRVKLTELPAG